MNTNRIKTVMLHTWYHLSHSGETWADLVWFPIVQFLVFGLIAYFLSPEKSHVLLLGYIFWVIIEVGQYSISVGALWEIWSKSFSSLFITPLTLNEFVAGQMLSGMLKSSAMFIVTSVLGIAVYGFSVFSLGPIVIVYFLLCLIFSWIAGMFVLAILFRFGTNLQSLAWSLIFLVQPLGAVFFPVALLPDVLQYVAYMFPVTHVFEAIRYQTTHGIIEYSYLLKAAMLNILFFVLAYWFMHRMHRHAKDTGNFVRIES